MRDLKKTIPSFSSRTISRLLLLLHGSERRVLGQLVRIAYDKETLVGWRAIEAVGMIAGDR